MKKNERAPVGVEVSRYLGYGLTWALSTLLFLYLGTLADDWLGSKPALTLIGAFLGAAAGFYYMYRRLTAPPPEKRDSQARGDRP